MVISRMKYYGSLFQSWSWIRRQELPQIHEEESKKENHI